MAESEIRNCLESAADHLEPDDPQPESILVTAGGVTMTMPSIDHLLNWTSVIEEEDNNTRVTYVAQQLWKQAEDQPAPTVIVAEYAWDIEDGTPPVDYRIVASSPLTMDQLVDATIDDRFAVTRSDVENLMLQTVRAARSIQFDPL